MIVLLAAIISHNNAESNGKSFPHETVAQNEAKQAPINPFRIRRQSTNLNGDGFSNIYGQSGQLISEQSTNNRNPGRPTGTSQNSGTPQTQGNSTSNSTVSDAQITQCIRNCPFVNHSDYVCASDGVTYMNEQHFKCAVKCGRRITIQYRAACA